MRRGGLCLLCRNERERTQSGRSDGGEYAVGGGFNRLFYGERDVALKNRKLKFFVDVAFYGFLVEFVLQVELFYCPGDCLYAEHHCQNYSCKQHKWQKDVYRNSVCNLRKSRKKDKASAYQKKFDCQSQCNVEKCYTNVEDYRSVVCCHFCPFFSVLIVKAKETIRSIPQTTTAASATLKVGQRSSPNSP